MPDRYHVQTAATPGRFFRVGKYGEVDFREDCSRCTNCVKLRCCFDVYKNESAHNRDPIGAVQTLYACKACLSCVQGCTKGLLSLSVNPEFLQMGDQYWRPEIIHTTWDQADSGKIPVSGAGYRGAFQGPGFDSIWTDMSEIVRPTRDGIHGREYISTSVDIGPRPMRLEFAPSGEMLTEAPPLLEVQIPAILDVPPWNMPQQKLARARALAARELRTLATARAANAAKLPAELLPYVIPICAGQEDVAGLAEAEGGMIQLMDSPELPKLAGLARQRRQGVIPSVRLPLGPASAERILELGDQGFKVFQLCADLHGCEQAENGLPGRHIKDVLREIHGRLVDAGIRDEITLIVSGGIALAEHMAKAVICGADLVGVDTALLVALGCRVCRESGHFRHGACPVGTRTLDAVYASHRMVNLLGAWHSQLIEVLGAMGLREVRRLRGEMGRAIFMEEIEREAFGDLARVPASGGLA